MEMNRTLMPSHFPAPAAPDFHVCNHFYSTPIEPKPSDCDFAFRKLPTGNDVISWTINPEPEEYWGLPFTVTYGTCQLQFQASGEAATELTTIDFPAAALREMAGGIISECVWGQTSGGYITRHISNTLDYITQGTTFYEDPFPTDTTFLSLIVWNSAQKDPLYNAGDMDPHTGLMITRAIAAAFYKEPEGPTKVNIERNYAYFHDAAEKMNRFSYRTWWDPPPETLNGSHANRTGRIGNLTLPAELSMTGPETLNLTHACGTMQQGNALDCARLSGGGGGVSTS